MRIPAKPAKTFRRLATGAALACAVSLTLAASAQATVIDPAFQFGSGFTRGLDTGMIVADGGGDIFDDAFVVSVSAGSGLGFFSGAVTGSEPTYSADQSIIGIDVNRRATGLVSNGAVAGGFEDYVYLSYVDSFTNTTGSTQNIAVNYASVMGSGGVNDVETDGGSTTSAVATDRWFTHGENGSDPYGGFFLHDGTKDLPTSIDANSDDTVVEWAYALDLAPGETARLLFFFTARNVTDTFGPSSGDDVIAKADILALVNAPVTTTLVGLTDLEALEVRNFTIVADGPGDPINLPEPATLALFGFGLAGLGALRRRRRNAVAAAR